MKVKQESSIIFLWMFLPFGLSEISCGALTVEYITTADSVNCKIQLFPSSYMRTYIMDSQLYRWIHTQNSGPRVILQKNAGTYDMEKYGEDNYTLLIRDLSKSDEGRYLVHCWTDNRDNFFSPEVTVNISENTQTTVVLPASPVVDTGIGTTAMIVISVCAVLIVAIIAGTIFVIICRRHGGQEGTKHLVGEDDSSGNTPSVKKEESVYSEIDTKKMTTDYAKVNEKVNASATQALLHSRKDPFKPSRSENKNVVDSGNEYDLVKCNEKPSLPLRYKNTNVVDSENEYAVVKDTDAITKDSCSEHEVVLPQSQKNEEENSSKDIMKKQLDKDLSAVTVINVEQEGKSLVKEDTCHKADDINESKVNGIDNADLQVYAKVQKQKPAEDITKDKYAGGIEYNIKFPAINCSEITKSLGDRIQMQGASECGDPVLYSNLVSRPQRVKSKRERLSRRSLQYAVLDLAKHEDATSGDRLYSEVLLSAIQPCQYASIDFEKRAFVAPIRKAPSSWYKRRNKKGKRK